MTEHVHARLPMLATGLAALLLGSSAHAQLATAPFTEDWESANVCSSTCGVACVISGAVFSNDVADDGDWAIDTGGTPSSETGPAVDHTLGTALGRYAYIEASGGCSPSQSFVVQSLPIDASALTAPSLQFWYHQYGVDMGTLAVQVKEPTTSATSVQHLGGGLALLDAGAGNFASLSVGMHVQVRNSGFSDGLYTVTAFLLPNLVQVSSNVLAGASGDVGDGIWFDETAAWTPTAIAALNGNVDQWQRSAAVPLPSGGAEFRVRFVGTTGGGFLGDMAIDDITVDDLLVDADFDGVTLAGGDCDDGDPLVFPGAAELCDGADQDCDGTADEDFDSDLDTVTTCGPDGEPGQTADNDCDDTSAATYPGAPELCDGLDNDCDGAPTPGELIDGDGDAAPSCVDCDDGDPTSYPGAPELCDGLDNDCNGIADAPVADASLLGDGTLAISDSDDPTGPTFGLLPMSSPTTVSLSDDSLTSTIVMGMDFEWFGTVYPSLKISSNGWITFDPSWLTSSLSALPLPSTSTGAPPASIMAVWRDLNPAAGGTISYELQGSAPNRVFVVSFDAVQFYANPTLTTTFQLHLHESTGVAELHLASLSTPGNAVVGGGQNQARTEGGAWDNRTGSLSAQANLAIRLQTLEATENDVDGDGELACLDCDEGDVAVNTAAPELCDGQDNDCNGLDDFGAPGVDGQEPDSDLDGSPACADCDDSDGDNAPGQAEVCDGQDNDCDGLDDFGTPGLGGAEVDGDGDGAPLCADCDDADPAAYPGAVELCDGADQNCDGQLGGEPDQFEPGPVNGRYGAATNRYRGSIWLANETRTIVELETELTGTAGQEFNFAIYEATALGGTWTRIGTAARSLPADGINVISSGPLSVPIVTGR